MAARRRSHAEDEPEQEIAPILASAVPPAGSTLATGEIAEYELPDGSTYMLTADEAKQRGAKARQPANKAITPRNK